MERTIIIFCLALFACEENQNLEDLETEYTANGLEWSYAVPLNEFEDDTRNPPWPVDVWPTDGIDIDDVPDYCKSHGWRQPTRDEMEAAEASCVIRSYYSRNYNPDAEDIYCYPCESKPGELRGIIEAIHDRDWGKLTHGFYLCPEQFESYQYMAYARCVKPID